MVWVGWALAFGRLTGLDEAGRVEAGVDGLAVGEPVGNKPVPVLLAGQAGDCLGESLEVSAGHVESLPDAQPSVKRVGRWAGGSASKLDGEGAVVDGIDYGLLDVVGVGLVAHLAFEVSNLLFQSLDAFKEGAGVLGLRLVSQSLWGHGGESLRDGFPHDGREGVLEGLGESLREQVGDGVGHGVVWCLVGGCRIDESSLRHRQRLVKG